MFPSIIKNVNTWYFHTKTSTPIDCLSTYFYRSLVRKTVCFGLYIDKTCVPDVFSESPLNTDTRIIRTLWHVPLVSVLTGFHCILFVTLFPTRLFGRVQYSLITSSQPITTEPLTNNTQSNQTNKKRKNSSDICLSFSRYTSNILKVNFDELRV